MNATRPHAPCVGALAVTLLAHTMALCGEDPNPGPVEAEVDTIEGRTIDHGFVIVDGEYVPPPYVVGRRGDELLINGRIIASDWFGRWPWRPPGPGMGMGFRRHGGGPGSPWTGRQPHSPMRQVPTRIERILLDDGLLVRVDGEILLVENVSGLLILDTLLSNAAPEDKVQALVDLAVQTVDPAKWPRLVEEFRPTAELADRVRPLAAEIKDIEQANLAASNRFRATAFLRSESVRYGITVTAMVLAVVAMGTILTQRPEARARWRDVDTEGDGVPMVIRNVVLLVLLGMFDLGLTLVAQQAGGLVELNPLGNKLLESPLLLAAFKGTTLLIACLILFTLRRYRGAQVASWWLCLLCTFLTFRWLTYNSLFLS